nr:MAG TPA_asm: hypothetical protein [Caudoviricetes sp.]
MTLRTKPRLWKLKDLSEQMARLSRLRLPRITPTSSRKNWLTLRLSFRKRKRKFRLLRLNSLAPRNSWKQL